MDKVEDLLIALHGRLDKVDPPLVKDRPFDPIFPELLEDGCLHAARAASPERIDYIATMIVNGITRGAARRLDHRYLMQLLGELNDVEVLLLIAAAKDGSDADTFWRRHEQVLTVPLDGPSATPEEADRAAVYDSYCEHLERLGLVTFIAFDPSVAEHGGRREDGYIRAGALRVMPLGRLLLEAMEQKVTAVTSPPPGPPKLAPDRVDAFWRDLAPVLRDAFAGLARLADARGARVASSIYNINFQATYEYGGGTSTQLQGYISNVDSWIWAEGPLSTNAASKTLVHLGGDHVGIYWEHGRRKRTSLTDLARLLTVPIHAAVHRTPGEPAIA